MRIIMNITIRGLDIKSERMRDQILEYYNSGGLVTDVDGNEIGKGISATRRGTEVHATIGLNEAGKEKLYDMIRIPLDFSIKGTVSVGS